MDYIHEKYTLFVYVFWEVDQQCGLLLSYTNFPLAFGFVESCTEPFLSHVRCKILCISFILERSMFHTVFHLLQFVFTFFKHILAISSSQSYFDIMEIPFSFFLADRISVHIHPSVSHLTELACSYVQTCLLHV